MSHKFTPYQFSAMRMVDAALPRMNTPPRSERLEAFEKSDVQLESFSKGLMNHQEENQNLRVSAIIPLGVYAMREALESLVRTDKVDYSISTRVADNVQKIANIVINQTNITPENGNLLGNAAELGVANMLWTGIAEGELGLSYAVLMGISGYEKSNYGLRGDVDIVTHTIPPYKPEKKKLQIKTSRRKANNIYQDGIKVIAVQNLFTSMSTVESVKGLLKWDRMDVNSKKYAYDKFNSVAGLT